MSNILQKYGQDFFVRKYILNVDTQKYLDDFDSGKIEIDKYFREKALNDKKSVTYMYVDTSTDVVVALATVSCASIPVFNDDEIVDNIPAIEIKYFALNERFQHVPYVRSSPYKLSHYVLCTLVEQLKTISTEYVGALKIVLQAMPDAVDFYSKCKFREMKSYISENVINEDDGCTPMFYNLNEVSEE